MTSKRTPAGSSDYQGNVLTSMVLLGLNDFAISSPGVSLAVGASYDTPAIPTVSFHHFQAWVSVTGAGTIGIEISGYHPVTGLAMNANCVLGNLVFGAAGRGTLYFGIGLDPPASAVGDKLRFTRLIRVTMRNNGLAVVTANLDLEMMG